MVTKSTQEPQSGSGHTWWSSPGEQDSDQLFIIIMAVVSLFSVRPSTYAAISTFFSVIFTVIAFSTPYWLRNENKKKFENLGLWEACFVHLRDRYFNYDREFHGCKWLFDEDYAFLRAEILEPSKY